MADVRYFGFKQEDVYGVLEDDTTYDFQVASADLDVPDDPNIPLPTLERWDDRHIAGFYSPEGSIEFPTDILTVTYFLKFGLGGYEFTLDGGKAIPEGEGDFNLHEIYATQEYELPSFSSRIGKDTFEHQFVGCSANTLSLSVENELAMLNVGVIAKKDMADDIREPPVDPADPQEGELQYPDPDLYPMAFYNVKVEIDSVNVSSITKSLSWEFDNGMSAEEGQGLGSRFPYMMRAGKGECNLTINVLDEDKDYLEEFWGTEDGPNDAVYNDGEGVDQHEPFPVDVYMESGVYGDIHIHFPRCYFTQVPTAITGGEPRRPDLAIKAEATNVTLDDDSTVVKTPVYIQLGNEEPEIEDPPE